MPAESEWVILDTSALVAFFANEPGAHTVATYRSRLAIPFVALTEFMCLIWRRQGEEEAVARYTLVTEWSRPILWPDERILFTTARLKAQYALGLADATIAAFAKVHRCPLLTKGRDYERLHGEVPLIRLP